MADIQLEIEGTGAITATEDLSRIEGLRVSYETEGETNKEGILGTIATIAAMTADTLEIATKLYEWFQKYRKKKPELRIEQAVIVDRTGQRILMANVTIDQLKKVLES
jgi:hypothetical protein